MINMNLTPDIEGIIIPSIHITCDLAPIVGAISTSGVIDGTMHAAGTLGPVIGGISTSGVIRGTMHAVCTTDHILGGFGVSGLVKGSVHATYTTPHIIAKLDIAGTLKGCIHAEDTTKPLIHDIQISGQAAKYGAVGDGECVLPTVSAVGVGGPDTLGSGDYSLPSVVAGGVAYYTTNGVLLPLIEAGGVAKYGNEYTLMPVTVSGHMVASPPPLSIDIALPLLSVSGSLLPPLHVGLALPLLHVTSSTTPILAMRCDQYKLPMLSATGQSSKGSRVTGAEVLPKLQVYSTVIVPKNISVLPKPSVTGTFARPKFCQGSAVLRRLDAYGAATASPAYTLFKPVVRASLQTIFTHTTGEYRLNSVTVVGHAAHYVASGKYQLPKLRVAGTASRTVTLSVKMQLPKVAAHGSFSYGASVVLRKVQVHASVTVGRTLRGAYTVQKLRATGAGVAAKAAPGVVRIYKPKVYGAVIVHRNTLGGCPFKAARATGTIKVGKALSAVYQSPRFKIVGRAGYTGNASTRYVLRKAVVNGAMICHRHT